MSRPISKLITGGLYLTLFLPLAFTPFTYFPWHFGKTIIFQMIVEVMGFLWLISLSRGEQPSAFTAWRKQLNYLDWSIIIFLLTLIVTAFTGIHFANSFWGNQARANGVFTWLHFGMWYGLVTNLFRREPPQRNYFLKVNVAVAGIVALTVLFQSHLPLLWQSGSGGGIIGNRAFAAAYLVASLGLAVYLCTGVVRWWRYGVVGVIMLLITSLFVLNNRGAVAGLGVGIVSGLLLSLWRFPGTRAKVTTATIGTLLVVFFLSFRLITPFHTVFPGLSALSHPTQLLLGTGATRLMLFLIHITTPNF